MTAVENIEQKFDMFLDWIFDRHPKAIEFTVADMYKAIEEAKANEKQQIIDAFETAFVEAYKRPVIGVATDNRGQYRKFNSAGQYYYENYKNETKFDNRKIKDIDMTVRCYNNVANYLKNLDLDQYVDINELTIYELRNLIDMKVFTKGRNVGKKTIDELNEIFSWQNT